MGPISRVCIYWLPMTTRTANEATFLISAGPWVTSESMLLLYNNPSSKLVIPFSEKISHTNVGVRSRPWVPYRVP